MPMRQGEPIAACGLGGGIAQWLMADARAAQG
jgi:hypothetical protein